MTTDEINFINEYITKRRKSIRKQFDKPINSRLGGFFVEEMEKLIKIQKILKSEEDKNGKE